MSHRALRRSLLSRWSRPAAAALLAVLLAQCSRSTPPPAPGVTPDAGQPDVTPVEQPNLAEPPSHDDLNDLRPLTLLSLRDKAAQLVMPWISGEYWATDEEPMRIAMQQVTDEHVGGFVVGLGGSAYDLAAKFNALQRASNLPLFIAADLESGPSMRVRHATAFPGNMALGATGRDSDAYDVGSIIASEGRAIGVNFVFAPVVDVNNNPLNPIINIRSFGEDPVRVGVLASAYVRGLREHGMLATAKHFPGHGDTGTDTHIALPVIVAGRARLDSVELVPFRMAMEAGVDAVMSAHIAMPAITGDTPATLSPAALDTLLRGELGFDGIVVTDALNMGAIVSRYGAQQAAVLALKAGADILLMPVDVHATIEAVVDAVQRGVVSEARLDSSVARVLRAKGRLGLFHTRTVDLSAIPQVVGIQQHQATAQQIAARALVLVKDSLAMVPMTPDARRVVVVNYADENNTTVGTTFAATLKAGGLTRVQSLRLWPPSGPASYDSVRTAVAGAGAVFVLVSARPAAWRPDAVNMPPALATLLEDLVRGGAPIMTISLGSPYLLNQVPSTPGYMVAWSPDEAAERAAAQAILGSVEITGRLPVSLPPWAPIGAGLARVVSRAAGSR